MNKTNQSVFAIAKEMLLCVLRWDAVCSPYRRLIR